MRMQVAENEAEKRELLDCVVNPRAVSERVYDARRPEPPPMLIRRPALGRRFGGALQPFNRKPIVEPSRAYGVRLDELQRPREVGRQDEKRRREYPRADGDARKRPVRPNQRGRQRHSAASRQRGDERHRKVVGYVGRHPRNLAQRAHHPVAEIVVADGLPRHPSVHRLPELRADGCVEEHEIHRLLGVAYGGVVSPEQRPSQESGDERGFGHGDKPPFAREEPAELRPVPIRQRRPARRQRRDQRQQPSPNARNRPRNAQNPSGVPDQQNPESLSKPVSPIRQLGQ